MDFLFLAARILHVALGVFWAGAMVFNAAFLIPSVAEAGPDGAKVMGGLMRRRFMDVMPAVAILTVISGFYLYWRVSGGFAPAWMGSVSGMTYGIGAVAGLVTLAIGLGVLRPAMTGAAALSASAAEAAPEERERLLRGAQALRARGVVASRIAAWLLVVATVTMAIGRYV